MIRNFTDQAANERTLLAWVRTSIAIIAFGFLIGQFDLNLNSTVRHSPLAVTYAVSWHPGQLAGIVLITLGVCTIAAAIFKFGRTAHEIDQAEMIPGAGSRTAIALASLLIFLVGGLFFYFVHSISNQATTFETLKFSDQSSRRAAMVTTGLTKIQSNFGPTETLDRLQAEIRVRGLTVFAHVDHAAGAKSVDLPLRPTDLVIFGNAKGGTPLMQSNPEIGIDLPLKVLVYQDADGKVWLVWNDPVWLAERHHLAASLAQNTTAMSTLLKTVTTKAAAAL